MEKKKKRVLAGLVIILVIVAVGAVWIVKNQLKSAETVLKIMPDDADFRMKDFVFTEVGHQQMRIEVRADTAEYIKKQNLAIFDQVHIKLTTKEGRVFVMTGDRGEMDTKSKALKIEGNVVILSDANDRFTTEYLQYEDSGKRIFTDAPVTMENDRMNIRGIGLQVYISRGELTLSSAVRARIR